MPVIVVERVAAPTAEAAVLVGELDAVLNAAYPPDQRHGLPLAVLFQPDIRFFLARIDAEPAGCGALALSDGVAEVKRMYSREAVRGRGVGKALLARIEAEARAAGRESLHVETGIYQTAAIGLYEAWGFVKCAPFGRYAALPPHRIAGSLFYRKRL